MVVAPLVGGSSRAEIARGVRASPVQLLRQAAAAGGTAGASRAKSARTMSRMTSVAIREIRVYCSSRQVGMPANGASETKSPSAPSASSESRPPGAPSRAAPARQKGEVVGGQLDGEGNEGRAQGAHPELHSRWRTAPPPRGRAEGDGRSRPSGSSQAASRASFQRAQGSRLCLRVQPRARSRPDGSSPPCAAPCGW